MTCCLMSLGNVLQLIYCPLLCCNCNWQIIFKSMVFSTQPTDVTCYFHYARNFLHSPENYRSLKHSGYACHFFSSSNYYRKCHVAVTGRSFSLIYILKMIFIPLKYPTRGTWNLEDGSYYMYNCYQGRIIFQRNLFT